MVDRIVLYDENYMFENYMLIIRFENKVNYYEITNYIMKLKEKTSDWNIIVDEISKIYKVKSYEEICGNEFIAI